MASKIDFINDTAQIPPSVLTHSIYTTAIRILSNGGRSSITSRVVWIEHVNGLDFFIEDLSYPGTFNHEGRLDDNGTAPPYYTFTERSMIQDLDFYLGLSLNMVVSNTRTALIYNVLNALQNPISQPIGPGYLPSSVSAPPKHSVPFVGDWNMPKEKTKPAKSEKALLMQQRRRDGLCLTCGDKGVWISLGCYCPTHGKIF